VLYFLQLLLPENSVKWTILLEELFVAHRCRSRIDVLPASRSFEFLISLPDDLLGVLWKVLLEVSLVVGFGGVFQVGFIN